VLPTLLAFTYAGLMSEAARNPDADDVPEVDAEDALHGTVSQLFIRGERMPVIIPGSIMALMPLWAELVKRAEETGSLNSVLPVAMPWASALPESQLSAFATDLGTAVSSGRHAPERLAACLREWQATAEIYADPAEAERLRRSVKEAEQGRVSPWVYDEASA
jgi:hypothetical protein